jgi:uncharacterized membrane protein (UPF0127 family)
MFKLRFLSVVSILAIVSSLVFAEQTDPIFPQIQVKVKQQVYTLEYANTFELRAQGLMHKEEMCNSCGMLFHFKRIQRAGMWMKNTIIPLDVAFIRADGKIADIRAMQPHDLTTTSSSEQILFAWEMNQGWFARTSIKVGDTVIIPFNNKP